MRSWFEPFGSDLSKEHRAVYARFEFAFTLVDFGAAFSFVVGSVFFLFEDLVRAGTWLFVVGSVLFACKPTIRLAREAAQLGHRDRAQERFR